MAANDNNDAGEWVVTFIPTRFLAALDSNDRRCQKIQHPRSLAEGHKRAITAPCEIASSSASDTDDMDGRDMDGRDMDGRRCGHSASPPDLGGNHEGKCTSGGNAHTARGSSLDRSGRPRPALERYRSLDLGP